MMPEVDFNKIINNENLRIGVMGTGNISEIFMDNISLFPETKVVAVYNKSIEKASRFCSKYNIEFACDDPISLIKLVDLVYIALPNSLHYLYSKLCLEHNKDVICEKPFTANYKEAQELVELANARKCIIVEVNRVTELPNFKIINEKKAYFSQESIVTITYCKKSRKYDDYLIGNKPNTFTSEFAGGALMDLGVYGLQFILELFGKPQNIIYKANVLPTKVDGFGVMILEYPNSLAVLIDSKITEGQSRICIESPKIQIKSEYAPSILKEIIINETGVINKSYQEYDNFYYFLYKALMLIRERRLEEIARWNNLSLLVMEIIDEAKKQNNMIF